MARILGFPNRGLLLLFGVIFLFGLVKFESAQAAPIKAGATCAKANTKSGNFICAKLQGKLAWQIKKKDQKLTHNFPSELMLTEQSISITLTSSAGLKVQTSSLTPKICGFTGSNLFTYNVGYCSIRINQSGDRFTNAAKNLDLKIVVKGSNEVSIVAPEVVKLSDRYLTLIASSTSGLKVVGTSQTPSVCRFVLDDLQFVSNGKCDILWVQSGDEFHPAASSLTLSIKVILGNQISASFEKEYKQSQGSVAINPLASSGYPVTMTTDTPTICSINGKNVELITPGRCQVTLSQNGDEFVEAAAPLQLSFSVIGSSQITFSLPSSLLLTLKSFALQGKSSSGLPLIYESNTPSVCGVSANLIVFLSVGKCEIRASHSASEFYEPATPVLASTTISAARSNADQPDSFKGFQVKPIYVLPSDVQDSSMDVNGTIASYLNEGRDFVKRQLNLTIPIDRVGTGYDIQFFKSKYSSEQIMLMPNGSGSQLMLEMGILENPGVNRKNYIFFIDVPYFNPGTIYCGLAARPGFFAIVAAGQGRTPNGSSCNAKSADINSYVTNTWIHEYFHNLGVEHTLSDACDIMTTSGGCRSQWTIDPGKTRYVNASSQGVDITKLPVWEEKTSESSLTASCVLPYHYLPRADGQRYAYCPTGTQPVGSIQFCWSSIRSAELQVSNNNIWVSLGGATQSSTPWGNESNLNCGSKGVGPTKQITVTTPGIIRYRWLINGTVSEEFTIIWVD